MRRSKAQVEGSRKGGKVQSQVMYYCALCDNVGGGNRFEGHHINRQACGGKGVVNYYAKLLNKRIVLNDKKKFIKKNKKNMRKIKQPLHKKKVKNQATSQFFSSFFFFLKKFTQPLKKKKNINPAYGRH